MDEVVQPVKQLNQSLMRELRIKQKNIRRLNEGRLFIKGIKDKRRLSTKVDHNLAHINELVLKICSIIFNNDHW